MCLPLTANNSALLLPNLCADVLQQAVSDVPAFPPPALCGLSDHLKSMSPAAAVSMVQAWPAGASEGHALHPEAPASTYASPLSRFRSYRWELVFAFPCFFLVFISCPLRRHLVATLSPGSGLGGGNGSKGCRTPALLTAWWQLQPCIISPSHPIELSAAKKKAVVCIDGSGLQAIHVICSRLRTRMVSWAGTVNWVWAGFCWRHSSCIQVCTDASNPIAECWMFAVHEGVQSIA